jgi:hypothetical protein
MTTAPPRFDRDAGKGTSRIILEKHASEEAARSSEAHVRRLARELFPRAVQEAAFLTYGRALADGGASHSALIEIGRLLVQGRCDPHVFAWGHLGDVLAVEEETAAGLLRAVPRLRLPSEIRRFADSTERYLALLALAETSEIVLDPTSNIFLNLGTEFLWRRATGVGTQDQLFDNGHARIGVGDSTTPEDRTHTDLQGASKTYQAVAATYPTITAGDGSGGAKSTFQAVFASGSANHGHKEWVIDNKNGGTPGVKVMNRKQQDFGTKASGSQWTYTNDLQIN